MERVLSPLRPSRRWLQLMESRLVDGPGIVRDADGDDRGPRLRTVGAEPKLRSPRGARAQAAVIAVSVPVSPRKTGRTGSVFRAKRRNRSHLPWTSGGSRPTACRVFSSCGDSRHCLVGNADAGPPQRARTSGRPFRFGRRSDRLRRSGRSGFLRSRRAPVPAVETRSDSPVPGGLVATRSFEADGCRRVRPTALR
jgi:hypothetical protein